MPGGGCALPGLRSYDLPLIYSPLLLETAGADGLKIAETFPGRPWQSPGPASAAPPGGQVPCPWWCRMAA
ncbi:hypothetical protein LN650_20765 [Klebsiella pneumoniae subsp. pneumoniae]|nr:hypothetical protein [Klebsiella pneumoniae subsp. pneumoniae]